MTNLTLSLLLLTLPILAHAGLEEPAHKPTAQIITHTGFKLQYNPAKRQAKWVAYELTKTELAKKITRTNNYRKDPAAGQNALTKNEFRGSGYDRGHLCPAGDQNWSKKAMSDSFFMTNMSPQLAGFNRGTWLKLEKRVRHWATKFGKIYIATGPIFTSNTYKTIGKRKVPVPNSFFKVILDRSSKTPQAIAFILPNKGGYYNLKDYAVTIDQAEKITGLDFFPQLPDHIEKTTEANLNLDHWFFPYLKVAIVVVVTLLLAAYLIIHFKK